MSSAISAALIAALVSGVGIFVQLWIARGTRRVAVQDGDRKLISEELKTQLEALRELAAKSETLRFHCWQVLGDINGIERDGVIDSSRLKENANLIWVTFHELLGAWSRIRFDIPKSLGHQMNHLWHSLRADVNILSVVADDFVRKCSGAEADDEARRRLSVDIYMSHATRATLIMKNCRDLAEIASLLRNRVLHAANEG